jgi:hypothetical protein
LTPNFAASFSTAPFPAFLASASVALPDASWSVGYPHGRNSIKLATPLLNCHRRLLEPPGSARHSQRPRQTQIDPLHPRPLRLHESHSSGPTTGHNIPMPSKKAPPPIYQLKITLIDIEPPIWRRIQVPCSIKMCCLHSAFQAVMGWKDSHLHEFEKDGRRWGTVQL